MTTRDHARRPRVRTRGWRFRSWLRGLVVVLTVMGLAPVAELVASAEAAVAAQPVDAQPCADAGAECDDCGAECDGAACCGVLHHCGCCAPMARIASPALVFRFASSTSPAAAPPNDRAPPADGRAPPLPPPRA